MIIARSLLRNYISGTIAIAMMSVVIRCQDTWSWHYRWMWVWLVLCVVVVISHDDRIDSNVRTCPCACENLMMWLILVSRSSCLLPLVCRYSMRIHTSLLKIGENKVIASLLNRVTWRTEITSRMVQLNWLQWWRLGSKIKTGNTTIN